MHALQNQLISRSGWFFRNFPKMHNFNWITINDHFPTQVCLFSVEGVTWRHAWVHTVTFFTKSQISVILHISTKSTQMSQKPLEHHFLTKLGKLTFRVYALKNQLISRPGWFFRNFPKIHNFNCITINDHFSAQVCLFWLGRSLGVTLECTQSNFWRACLFS